MKQYNFNGILTREYGAYVRTLLNSNTQINGVGSGVVGMVGLSERGEADEPTVVYSFKELVEKFGDGPIVRHGLAAFLGGASQIVAVRIGNPISASLSAGSVGADSTRAYTVRALEKGTYGNSISFGVRIGNITDNQPVNPGGTSEEQARQRISENNDFYEVLIRYTNRAGQDIRERFVFPRYMPSVDVILPDGSVGSRFYKNNTNYFFMLKDRETGVVREVPEVWTYGAVTTTEFLGRVDDLKGVNEDLITFPVYDGDKRNFFPMSVIAHVINNGGFGYNPSIFVRVEDIDVSLDDLKPTDTNGTTDLIEVDPDFASSTREELIVHEPVALSGGFNGDDGTSFYSKAFSFGGTPETVVNYEPTLGSPTGGNGDIAATQAREEWIRGLGVLENFDEINFVIPAYLFNPKAGTTGKGTTWKQRIGFFKSVAPLVMEHVGAMSNTKTRKFRTTILGLPWYKSAENARKTDMDFLNDGDVREISGLINNDRVQLWVGGFKSRALSTKLEPYGGEMLASFATGLHSSKEVPDSLTFEQISGIFTDGMEFYWTTQAVSELYARSFNSILRRSSITGATQYIASSNVTSWTGSESRGLTHWIVRRTVDYMNTYLYKNLEENFIGTRAGGEETNANLQRYVEDLLQRLVNERILVKAENVVVRPVLGANNAYEITYDFRPYNEVDFIFTTNSLRWDI